MSVRRIANLRNTTHSLLFELRAGTANLHAEIEACVPLLREDLSLVEYRKFLEKLLCFYRPMEANMVPFAQRLYDRLDLSARTKSCWLVSDLQQLKTVAIEPVLTPNFELPTVNTVADLIGVLYVLEGATLGGQIILRTLKKNLRLRDDQMRFYRGYGEANGRMWRNFCVAAELLLPTTQHGEAVQTARKTFSAYKRYVLDDIQCLP